MEIIIGILVNPITGAHTETIGLPRLTAPLPLASSLSTLPTSTRSSTAARATVSQFAVLQHSDKSKTNTYSSTSPSVIVENAPLNFVRGGDYEYDGTFYGKIGR